MKALLLLGVALIAAAPASAEDWRYCLAISPDDNKVYMSEPIQTNASMSAAADAFSRLLARLQLRHQDVQCPKSADEKTALAMREHAISFNRSNGREIANVNGKP
jgi:hypothetical protein